MKDIALKLLNKIEDAGYQAYIVGGFVRNELLGLESNDIDITTNATPKDLCSIFKDAIMPKVEYGAVSIIINQIPFEITTFRKEFDYQNNRRPEKIIYIDSLKEDLLRRDFTINTICMDKNGSIIDLLNGKKDLDAKEIKTVQDSISSFSLDALRILRAIRFATSLNFKLSIEVKEAIIRTKYLLRALSKERVKEELNKIFSSQNSQYGIDLLLELKLDEVLDIPKLKNIHYYSQSIGIWAFLEVEDQYPFSKNEKEMMEQIRKASLDVLNPYSLYQNGLYASYVAGEMLGISKKEIAECYEKLPIKGRKELLIKGTEIAKLLGKEPGPYLSKWIEKLEQEVVLGHLKNEKRVLLNYCLKNQSMIG